MPSAIDWPCEPSLGALANEILLDAERLGVPLRLTGGLAIWYRCEASRYLVQGHRWYHDLDVVAPLRFRKTLEDLITQKFGLRRDRTLGAVPGTFRSSFLDPSARRILDVNYDRLEYCHTITLLHRLELDPITIPLAELLLSKLQIVEMAGKDFFDVALLLRDHELAAADGPTINTSVVTALCGCNWGLERTCRHFLHRLRRFLEADETEHRGELLRLTSQIARLLELLDLGRKSFGWRLRGLIGESIRWYETVEPLSRSMETAP
jgi:hypothetical protein